MAKGYFAESHLIWKAQTRGTYLGIWWLPLRAIINNLPILIIAGALSVSPQMAAVEKVFLNLGIWLFLEQLLRNTRKIKALEKKQFTFQIWNSKFRQKMNLLLTGLPESIAIVFLSFIISLVKGNELFSTCYLIFLHYTVGTFLILPVSWQAFRCLIKFYGMLPDFRFLLPSVLRVILFCSTFIVQLQTSGLFSILQYSNPLTFIFTFPGVISGEFQVTSKYLITVFSYFIVIFLLKIFNEMGPESNATVSFK